MVTPAKRFGCMFLKTSGPYSGRRSSSSGSGELFFLIESAFVTCQQACADDPDHIAVFDKGYQHETRSTALAGYELAFFGREGVIGVRTDSGEIIRENCPR